MLANTIVETRGSAPSSGHRDHLPVAPFAELLRARFGLTFPEQRRSVLVRAIGDGMAERGLASADEYLRIAMSQNTALDRLASFATTGETYFFRNPEQLAVLRRHVVPAILDARAGDADRVIRAWSAGCATGEEAYSVAAVLSPAMPPDGGWQTAVVGTDLNGDAISTAVSGIYGRWSFRAAPSPADGGFITQRDGRAVIAPVIRSVVQFSVQNLAAPDAVRPPALGGPADIVLCRNVLMYLEDEAARRVVNLIHGALRPGGWLVIGPTDVTAHTLDKFERTVVDGVTLYRRGHADAAPTGPTEAAGEARPQALSPPVDQVRVARRAAPRRAAQQVSTPRPRHEHAGNGDATARARRLADAGRHVEAARICRTTLRAEPANRDARRLLIDMAEAEADLPTARAGLRALLIHAPEDTLMRFRLALVERQLGDYQASQRNLARVLAGIADLPDDEQLDDGGDLSVLRLRSIAATMPAGEPDD